MNKIKLKLSISEFFSLDNRAVLIKNGVLSQNQIAVCQTAQIGFFIAQNLSGRAHPTTGKTRLPAMGRLRLQNKPIGEYVAWLLFVPRVRPPHPIFRVFTQNQIGTPIMNTNPTGTPASTPNPKSLDKSPITADNTATTKRKAVQPSRHSLAIFTPTMGVIRHLKPFGLLVYGGLIAQNTIALVVNMCSRLFAVVETCHPINRVVSLTKRKGNPTMKAIRFIHALLIKLSYFTRLESLVIGLCLGACVCAATISALVLGGAL